MPESASTTAVCVAGMHRSGTSMVAHVLAEAGVDLGPEDEFLPANADNADGYWENRRFVALNDSLLAFLGGGWDVPPAVRAGWEHNAALASLEREARRLIEDLALAEPWGWKDPRTSLTLPFWRRVVPGLRVVVCVRNPVEVVLSLERRAATSPALGIELWREYNRRLLEATSPEERVVTVYDAYFADARAEVGRLMGRLGIPLDSHRMAAAAVVPKTGVRRHTADALELRESGVPADVAELYEALVEEAQTGVPAEVPTARVRPRRRANAEPARSTLAQAVSLYKQRDSFRSEAAEARGEVQRLAAELEAHQSELKELRPLRVAVGELAAVREELEARTAEVQRVVNDLEASARELQAVERERELWHIEAAKAAAELSVVLEQSRRRGRRRRTISKLASWLVRPTPRRVGYLRRYLSLRGSFDRNDYLRRNPDVAHAGWDGLLHYIEHGRSEGREARIASARVAPELTAGSESTATADPPPAAADLGTGTDREQRPAVQPALRDNAALLEAFDADFYRARNPDVHGTDSELLEHYLVSGWTEDRDPCRWFSTSYYLAQNPDVRGAGLNPFLHYLAYGRSERRAPTDYLTTKRLGGFRPTVSAIVPNFNHGRFLEERIRSIVEQERKPDEIIILDDASTDDSRAVIERVTRGLGIEVRTAFNETRSGNVFKQWQKGISLASGDLMWICESDDFADPDFLGRLVPYFADPSVMIAFGKIQFADEGGLPDPWLDTYREEAASGHWDAPRVRSAFEWFRGPFGLANVIPNVGGCLLRRNNLSSAAWEEAQRFSVCGDWYVYIQMAHAGRIAYHPGAVSYFRQHSGNTSVSQFGKLSFYEEHFWIARELRRSYGIDARLVHRFHARIREHYLRHFPESSLPEFDRVFDLQELLSTAQTRRHILIGILGLSTGGAELFGVNLANALVERGYNVSLLVLDPAVENPHVKARVRPEIPVYERPLVEEIGLTTFLETHAIDLVHTHFLGVDRWFHQACRSAGVPYVVTLHGSYEVDHLDRTTIMSLLSAVTEWVYTADKNLNPFADLPLDGVKFTKMPNAVPAQRAKRQLARRDLRVPESAFIFGLASRALKSKGWEIAIKALDRVQTDADRPVALAFCGDGDDYDELATRYAERSDVVFLGHQSDVIGFYEACDCCILPSRFAGESFPFTLIESLQAGTPIIATDIGEVATILHHDGARAGIVVPNIADDDEFVAAVAAAMLAILDEEQRDQYAHAAKRIATNYSFPRLTSEYENVYRTAAGWRADQ